MPRIIKAGDVGHLVKNGATVYCTGMGLAGFAEEAVLVSEEEPILTTTRRAPVTSGRRPSVTPPVMRRGRSQTSRGPRRSR